MKQRSYCLDVLKLLLSYVIAFFHFGLPIPPGSSVTVQIFFLLSGFFLGQKFYARSFSDPEHYTAWDYTLDHVRRLYPHYLFSMLAFFLYTLTRSLVYLVLAPSWEKVQAIAWDFFLQIPDLFLVQSSFRFHESLNYPLWQLSAMLIAGYFLYGLLCWREKLARRLLLPGAILMGLSLMNTGVDLWSNWGAIYIPLLRAFYPMSLGVLTYYFTRTPYYEKIWHYPLAMNLASLLAIASVLAYGEEKNAFLITVPILILVCWDPQSWLFRLFQKPCFRNAGKLSYAVYLNHALIARFVTAVLLSRLEPRGLFTAPWQQGLLFFFLVTLWSWITLHLVDRWVLRRKPLQAPLPR